MQLSITTTLKNDDGEYDSLIFFASDYANILYSLLLITFLFSLG